MKHSHRLFTVLIMLSMILGLLSMPAFTQGSAVQAQDEVPTLTPEPATEPIEESALKAETLAQIDDAQSTTGPIPPAEALEAMSETEGYVPSAEAETISDVPAYIWRHGCGPTAAGMVIGYWDGYYDDRDVDWLIDGDSSTQTLAADEAMASQGGIDTPSHYNDYSYPIDDVGSMQLDKSSLLPAADRHPNDSIADFMKTSWSSRKNQYGWSYLSDVQPALLGYAAMRNPGGFTVSSTTVAGMSWTAFQAEINAERPVVLLVDSDGNGTTDHFIPAVGYDTTAGGTKMYAAYTTWDTDLHWFTFHPMSNGDAWGIYSGTTFKITAPTPATPSLLAPLSNFITNNTMPTLSWKPAANATAYRLQVSASSAFSGTIVDDDTITGTSYTPSSSWSGKLYWRVSSQNVGGTFSAWSSARYFTVDTVAPDAPVLKLPLNDDSPLGVPTFSWNKSATATRYQFQYNIGNDPGTDDPTSVVYRSGELTTTSHKPFSMPMVEYNWFVRAKDSAGNWSAWSAPFTVTVLPLKPGTPSLVLPTSNAFTNDTTPELTWKSAAYGDTYQVQISTLSNFAGAALLESDTPTSYVTDSLADGKWYWHVRATNENNVVGSWSSARYFTVDTIAPAAPAQKSPLSGAMPLGVPTFTWVKPLGSPVRYQFEYNTTNDPGTDDNASVTFRSGELTKTSFKPLSMPMVEYYWFVRAKDAAGNWSGWSSPSFTITVLPLKPAAPKLNLPATGFRTDDTSPDLSWLATPYGYTYEVQVDDLSTFLSPNYISDPRVSGLSHTPGTLVPGKWYWRVRAWNENGVYGPWSASRYFTIFPKFNTQFNTDGVFEGWEQHPGAAWNVSGGNLSTNGLGDWLTSSASYPATFTDFTYEARMKMNNVYDGEGIWHGYGLVVRGTPIFDTDNQWETTYFFMILNRYDASGTPYACYQVYKIYNGSWSYPGNGCSSLINFNNWNTLKVYANSSTLKFYINDNLMWNKAVSGITSGRLGVFTMNESSPMSVDVDWAVAGAPVLPLGSLSEEITPNQWPAAEFSSPLPQKWYPK